MKRLLLATSLLFGSALALLITPAKADPWNEKTFFSTNEPLQIGSVVLAPGRYVLKLAQPLHSRDVVEILNGDETHLISTVATKPAGQAVATDHSRLTFYETPNGQPRALKDWFYPGELNGHQFDPPASVVNR